MNQSMPAGIVTFLFTDIQGSTRLWQEKPVGMSVAHARHNSILRTAIESHRGYVFQVIGDAFCAAFHTPGDALCAALEAQKKLHSEQWGEAVIKVRMGIHTGEAELQEGGDYRGFLTLSRLQRLMSAAHGGQTLVSLTTQELLQHRLPEDASLLDMGTRRLKDWNRPEQIFQLVIEGLPSEFPPLRALDASPHNLPAPTTSFIGREKEKAEIKQALTPSPLPQREGLGARDHRLVTLTGSGGTGKTRLSLQVAADLLDQFADGVWFVELAPLTDPHLIPQTILSAMRANEQEGKTALETLVERVREQKALLILDNCEHLIEASAKIAETLLASAPALRILASSREALSVPGELAWHVPSMTVPETNAADVERLLQFESVRLFVERAALAQPRFTLTRENAPHIAQICLRLDGIPLALELAAARVKALDVEEVAARLDDRFRLLTGGARTALPRQQTLRAMIDWSYNLLAGDEKKLFRRLAVFVGGWTLEAAEQICAGEDALDVIDLLARLVDKSLVALDESSSRARYRMLETTRQYARETLLNAGETAAFRNRHLDYFLQYAETGKVEMRGRKQAAWLAQLETEHDNLRAALEWSQDNAPERGLRIAAALTDFWDTRGYLNEARRWLDKTLQATAILAPTPARVDAMMGAMAFAIRQSELDVSKKILEEALALARTIDYKAGIARGLTARGVVTEFFDGDLTGAEALYNEALTFYREAGDNLAIGQALGPLASCALKRYDFAKAESLYGQSLSLFRAAENEREIAGALGNLAEVALSRHNYAQAEESARESYALYHSLADKHGVATALRSLSIALHNRGQLEAARSASEESAGIFRELGDRGCLILTLTELARQIHHQGDVDHAAVFIREARLLLNQVGQEVISAGTFDVYGRVALAQGDHAEACKQFADGLRFQQKARDAHFVPSLLEGLAGLLQPQDAIRLLGAAASLREKTDMPLMRVEQNEYERTMDAMKTQVTDAEFQSLWERGSAMTIDEAILFALEKGGT
ncbi:MAG: tetratricopeptide repeat protein [Anaerolineales bacterium]|nr:tetratricopeptide repeat protein [Anaerolineales bacterium]